MLKVYLDCGKKSNATEGVVSVAATVFTPQQYVAFTGPWNQMLFRWGAPAFHATDFYPGGGHFKRHTAERKAWFEEDSKGIPGMIGRYLRHGLVVAFKPDEFAEKFRGLPWLSGRSKSVQSIAVQRVLIRLGYWAQETNHNDGFTYFMERGDEDAGIVMSRVRRMQASPRIGPHIQVREFRTLDKSRARGLETADFLAWHWNKYWADRLSQGKKWDVRKDFQAFINHVGHFSGGQIEEEFITGEAVDQMVDWELFRHFVPNGPFSPDLAE